MNNLDLWRSIDTLKNMDKKLIKRWAKDYSVSISYYEPEYVKHYLSRLMSYKQDKVEALYMLNEELKDFNGNVEELLSSYIKTTEQIIETIKGSKKYKEFNEEDMNRYSVKTNIGSGKVYTKDKHCKKLVSIDLVKANFQMFKKLGVLDTQGTWEEYVGKFTGSKYLAHSKYLRQVIFGNCNPRRQVTVEKYYMNEVLNYILANEKMDGAKIIAFYHDELVFEETREDLETKDFYRELTESIKRELDLEVDIEVFEIEHVKGDFCIKHFENKEGYEVSGLPGKKFLQGLAYVYNDYICAYDRYFWDDGNLAEYVEGDYVNIQREEKWREW